MSNDSTDIQIAVPAAPKRSWVRWWGLVIFLLLGLFWYLCIDWIAETLIETLATEVNGARVELDSAEVNLFPTRLTLAGLQVTNPEQPMSNLVSARQLVAQIDGPLLLGRHIVIDEATVSGLAINSPRKSSGATTTSSKKASGGQWDFDLGGVIPGLSLPDTDALLKAEEQHLKNEVKAIEGRVNAIKDRWDENIKNLPDDDTVKEYKARWKKAKKGNLFEKVTTLNSIKDDIDKDLKQIRQLDDQLKADKKLLAQEVNYAKTMPQREAKRLLSQVGLSEDSIDFISALTGEQIKQYLQKSLALFSQLSKLMGNNSDEEQAPQRGEGQWVHFQLQQPIPQLLVKRIQLDGDLPVLGETYQGTSIQFQGEARDFAFPPEDWQQPATIKLQGKDQQNARFIANALFDHRNANSYDQLEFDISDLLLNNLALSKKPELQMLLEKATTSLQGKITLQQLQLNMKIDGNFKDIALQAQSDSEKTAQKIIVDTLQGIQQFDLALTASGDSRKPAVRLKSNLDSIIGRSMKQQVSQQMNALQGKLQQKIQQKLGADLNALQANTDFLQQVEALMAKRKSDLQDTAQF